MISLRGGIEVTVEEYAGFMELMSADDKLQALMRLPVPNRAMIRITRAEATN